MRLTTLFVLLSFLAACSSGGAQVESETLSTERRLAALKTALDSGDMRNASMIRQYCSVLRSSRPELRELFDALENEASTKSPLYQSLQSRLKGVKDGTETFAGWVEKVDELQAIQVAARISVYNDALSDTVNVLADLSNGELARVNAVSQQVEQRMNRSKDRGPGSQYMGNPHYGHWSHGAGGSFWAWYGQYAFFSRMFGGRQYYYHNWSRDRGYSYYHDVGRSNYTSRSQRTRQAVTETRARKQFGSGRHKSPYAKTRSGASGLSKASTTPRRSYSSGSSRSRGFRTSRGVSRGK